MAVRAEGGLAIALATQQCFARAQAPRHARQLQRRDVRAQARIHAGQRQVGGETGQAGLVDIDPGAQRATAPFELDRIIDEALPRAQVDVAQVGIQLALPARDIGRLLAEAVPETRTDVDRAAQPRGRRGRQRQVVRTPAVEQRQRDALQRQRRRAAQFVDPVDAAIADDDLALAQQPVGAGTIALLLLQPHAGHDQHAVAAAPHGQARTDDFKRCKPGFERGDAPPADRSVDLRQGQHLPAPAVVQAHVAQRQRRAHAMPGRRQLRDRDAAAECIAGHALDVALVQVDVGKDGVAQHQEQHGQREIHDQQQLDGKAQHVVRGQVREAVARAQPAPAYGQRPGRGRRLRIRVVHQGANNKGSPKNVQLKKTGRLRALRRLPYHRC